MARYVALLRSVNVGGRSLPMAALRETLVDAGFEDVATYIQSGNVIFTSPSRSEATLGRRIEAAIKGSTGHEVPVLVRSPRALQSVVTHQPFARGHDPKFLHVTFLAEKPSAARIRAIDRDRYLPDEFSVAGREVYLACPTGYGRTKLNNTFFERALGTVATTRNWNTVRKLLELAS